MPDETPIVAPQNPESTCLGDSFYGTFDPRQKAHLWVIISNPDPDGNVVVVNLTSQTFDDDNCLLSPKDHPFVTRSTAIEYDEAKSVHPNQIKAAIENGIWEQRERFRSEVLRRIQDGALQSENFAKKFRLPVQSSLVSVK